jgi:hypothetical protein
MRHKNLGRWALTVAVGCVAMGCEADRAVVGESAAVAPDVDETSTAKGVVYRTNTQILTGTGAPDLQDCLARPLPVRENGAPACLLVEVDRTAGCDCGDLEREPASESLRRIVLDELVLQGDCGEDGAACEDACFCGTPLAVGDTLGACLEPGASEDASSPPAWCYVSPSEGFGTETLAAECPHGVRVLSAVETSDESLPGLLALVCGSAEAAAGSADVGEPCALGEEASPSFAGTAVGEINLETGSLACTSGICLVNHFQGRASCPYGQTAEEIEAGEGSCRTLGAGGPVTVPVPPGLVDRPAEQVSTCSCRCGGPGPGPFCVCPESMECAPLIEDLGFGGEELAGSYCIPAGAVYDPRATSPDTCDRERANCGDEQPFPP